MFIDEYRKRISLREIIRELHNYFLRFKEGSVFVHSEKDWIRSNGNVDYKETSKSESFKMGITRCTVVGLERYVRVEDLGPTTKEGHLENRDEAPNRT